MGPYAIEDLLWAVEKEAKLREEIAGYSGERHDGGAGRLREQVKFFEMGRKGLYPIEWETHAKHIDPEYQEYIRLRKKFGPHLTAGSGWKNETEEI